MKHIIATKAQKRMRCCNMEENDNLKILVNLTGLDDMDKIVGLIKNMDNSSQTKFLGFIEGVAFMCDNKLTK